MVALGPVGQAVHLVGKGVILDEILNPAKERRPGAAQRAEDHHNQNGEQYDGETLCHPDAGEHQNVLGAQVFVVLVVGLIIDGLEGVDFLRQLRDFSLNPLLVR